MTDANDLAALIFSRDRAEATARLETGHTVTGYAVATSDSDGGTVQVRPAGVVVAPADGDGAVEVPTTVDVREGDQVLVTGVGEGLAQPVVTGVVGGGDRTRGSIRDNTPTQLYLYSTRGTAFKNSTASTELRAVVIHGAVRCTTAAALQAEVGAGAYLQWSLLPLGEETPTALIASDPRITADGFSLTVTAADVPDQCVVSCDLMLPD